MGVSARIKVSALCWKRMLTRKRVFGGAGNEETPALSEATLTQTQEDIQSPPFCRSVGHGEHSRHEARHS